MKIRDLAKMIDHSLLHPTMTDGELREGCLLARKYDVASVCIKPYAVPLAREILAGSRVEVGTVIGFPHGNSHVAIKVSETSLACSEGATEIDMVVNIGKVLGGDWTYVEAEIRSIQEATLAGKGLLKVIFENDYLQEDQIIRLCRICGEIGVAFVKTSSGYGFVKQADGNYNYKGATDAHLKLMRQHSPASVQVKAAGGVRSLADLLRVRELGVTRVGATATATILNDARAQGWGE